MMVESTTYRPWRAMGEPDDLLADDVSRQWRQLLEESRQCVVQLREMTTDADRRLGAGTKLLQAVRQREQAGRTHQLHQRIINQLDAFEHRLRAIESRMVGEEPLPPETIPHPMTQPRSDAA